MSGFRIETDLWRQIEAAVGGSIRLRGAKVIQMDTVPAGDVIVVMVESTEMPDDAEMCRRFGLTARQSAVARLMADRLTTKEISRRLGIRQSTVRRHCEAVLSKMELHTRNDVRLSLLNAGHAPAQRFSQQAR